MNKEKYCNIDVVCVGFMVCDILVKPVGKELLDKDEERVEFIKMSTGGDALNVAFNLKKLGFSSAIIGKIGNDGFGEFLLNETAKNGIDTTCVRKNSEIGTSVSAVLIHKDGERSIAHYGGASDYLCEADIDFELIKKAKALAIGSALNLPGLDGDGLTHILEKASVLGIKTVMDVTGRIDPDKLALIRPALAYTDIFVPSNYQARILSGYEDPELMADVFLKSGAKIVVIKFGKDGCFIKSSAGSLRIPAYHVEAIDTTGAGDAFVSGFIAGHLKGMDLYGCGQFANAAGAFCVQHAGATSWEGDFESLDSFIKQRRFLG